MKDPFDEIREKTQHIQNHIHWWLCPYGRPYGQIVHQEDYVHTLGCIRKDAAAIVATCDRMLEKGGDGNDQGL